MENTRQLGYRGFATKSFQNFLPGHQVQSILQPWYLAECIMCELQVCLECPGQRELGIVFTNIMHPLFFTSTYLLFSSTTCSTRLASAWASACNCSCHRLRDTVKRMQVANES